MFMSESESGPLETTLTQNNVLERSTPGKDRRRFHHSVVTMTTLRCCYVTLNRPSLYRPSDLQLQHLSGYFQPFKNTRTHTLTKKIRIPTLSWDVPKGNKTVTRVFLHIFSYMYFIIFINIYTVYILLREMCVCVCVSFAQCVICVILVMSLVMISNGYFYILHTMHYYIFLSG